MMKPNGPFFAMLIAAMLVVSAPVHAEAEAADAGPQKTPLFPASSWTQEKTYLDKTTNKFGFGFLNLTTGWTAFFYELKRARYFFDGLGKGSLYAITDTVGGVLHIATSPVPVDIPLPEGGISHEYYKR